MHQNNVLAGPYHCIVFATCFSCVFHNSEKSKVVQADGQLGGSNSRTSYAVARDFVSGIVCDLVFDFA